jgi:hypothetical protein
MHPIGGSSSLTYDIFSYPIDRDDIFVHLQDYSMKARRVVRRKDPFRY